MKPEGGILPIRDAGMRPLRMEAAKQRFEEPFPLPVPFVEPREHEQRLHGRQPVLRPPPGGGNTVFGGSFSAISSISPMTNDRIWPLAAAHSPLP